MTTLQEMAIPGFYNPDNAADDTFIVENYYQIQNEAEKWRKLHSIKPSGGDKKKVHLLVIDAQYDFSFPKGTLYVAGRSGNGAVDANRNLAEFIYRYLHILSHITCTMDTHVPYQIFFPSAHLTDDDSHPEPNTLITSEDYKTGKYRPHPAFAKQIGADPVWLQKQMIHYCEELEKTGKYQLFLWPYHCMLGSQGHRLAGIIEEACLFHSFSRGSSNIPEIKGGNPLSERYSIFKEEVTTCFDHRPIPGAQKNTHLIKTLLESDLVILAGLASSHCVKESIDDLLGDIKDHDPELAKKVYILKDCTAPVVLPNGPDFTDEAEAAFQRFQSAGMNLVDSKTPLFDWPEVKI